MAEIPGSKVRIIKDSWEMLISVFGLYIKNIF